MPNPSITLYATPLSGHCHRVEALLHLLDLPFDYREAPAQLRQSEEFLALNPLRQIPVLVDGDLVLADSNAILVYLAKRYDRDGVWYPDDPVVAARIQRWLSIAAGEVYAGPCIARLICLFGLDADLAAARRVADRLLPFVDRHLTERAFLAHDTATIADLACYAYIAHAPEGGISLDPYAHIRAWLARVEALPRFKRMPSSAVPA
jgi:glutathione S-transferase